MLTKITKAYEVLKNDTFAQKLLASCTIAWLNGDEKKYLQICRLIDGREKFLGLKRTNGWLTT